MKAVRSLSMDELRGQRREARRDLELAVMRERSDRQGADESMLTAMRERVRSLTDELIARYAADLGLVDSLLEAAPQRHPVSA